MADLRRACEEWAEVLGTENIVTDARLLAEREAMTFALRRRIPVILRPGRVGEVQACMRIANARGVPVYPVSSGRNWGYGSSAPSADGCALLDLSRMNAILDYNEDLAYVTVEPGVTQRQLFNFLAGRGAKLWMDATGSSPDCSLVGNTVERGFGHTPYGDHFANSCAYEVVLPTGERAQTGFRQLPGARAGQAYRWGVGPVIDGLFTQSNLGIVTRMTIWLMPAPEAFQAFFFKADQDEGLEGLIGALRTLRLEGTLRSAVHIGNDYRVLTSIGQYPWEDAKGAPPLPADVLGALAQRHEFGAWNGSGALYGTPAQVRAARARVRTVLGPHVDQVRFLDDRLLRVARRYQGAYRRLTGLNLREVLALVEPVYGLMKGIPTSAMLASTYWRKRVPAPANPDPDRDRCGLLWCAPVAPADPRPVREMVTLIREVFSRHPFEPALSMTLRTERSVDSVVSISYDRDVPGEDERAMQCHDELLGRLSRSGFYPYRLGLQSLDKLPPRDEGSASLLKAIKAALDPNQVLAPGRYL
jgi:4-cresol dehydrogenase (hydroxylating)